MAKTPLFASAEAAWPEDEASLTATSFRERMADAQDDADRAYYRELLAKDVAHMLRVFSAESDAADLSARYVAKVAELTGETVKQA